MQKIVNKTYEVVEDMLSGFVSAHSYIQRSTLNEKVLKTIYAGEKGRVGIVTGGGSGHKPAFIGYLGKNFCDSVAVGEIFTSPPALAFYNAFKEANGGEGVVCLYGNYAGDNMNVKIAMEMAKKDRITVKTVVANDDVASAPVDACEQRRGVAGEILMWKVAGAKSGMGGNLDEVVAVASKAINNTRSIGIGLIPCTIPDVGHPNFTIKENTMEIGIGHHGEPGIGISPLSSSKEIAQTMLAKVLPDLPFRHGDEAVVLVSGLGATPVMELYILFNDIFMELNKKGINVFKAYVGNYFTSLDMGGATLSLLKLDQELKDCIAFPCESVGLTQINLNNCECDEI